MGKLSGVKTAPAGDPKTLQIDNAKIEIKELFAQVDKDPVLRDSCIILPHFSDEGAHKHLNVKGYHERFSVLPCYGVYIEKPFGELDQVTKDKAYGLVEKWGKRRKPFIATGDNKRPTWERLGAHECWIKLGETHTESTTVSRGLKPTQTGL
jgi:chromosome segregation protein